MRASIIRIGNSQGLRIPKSILQDPWRVPVYFAGKSGHVVVDQIRTVDRERLLRKLGELDTQTATRLVEALAELFAA